MLSGISVLPKIFMNFNFFFSVAPDSVIHPEKQNSPLKGGLFDYVSFLCVRFDVINNILNGNEGMDLFFFDLDVINFH